MSDYERPDAWWTHYPKARKQHTCCECGGKIHKGETYQRVEMLLGGSFDRYKTCSGCETLRDHLRYEYEVESYFGGLFECMEESGVEINPMEVLAAMAS